MAHPQPVAPQPQPALKHHAAPLRPAFRLALVCALLLLALGVLALPATTADAPTAYAAEGPAPSLNSALAAPDSRAELLPAFKQASLRYNVPIDLLMAIGYVESRWTNIAREPEDIKAYGVMGLTLPPSGNTLTRAAQLLGLSPEAVKFDAAKNIMGAAAVLRSLAEGGDGAALSSAAPASWYNVVAAYGGMTDPVVARSYAFAVFSTMSNGAGATTAAGERLEVAAQGKLAIPDRVDPLLNSANSNDYPAAHWVAANGGNYKVGRDYGPLNFIVIHDTEGTYQSAINWFQNGASGVSAHYVIRSSDGDVTQMVRQADTAYHAGNWDYNVRAIGVEHEGYMSNPGQWYTAALYNRSADLVRGIADQYGIKKDHAHIIGHYQVPNQANGHTDPGPGWDWNAYLANVRRDWAASARVDNTDGGFVASPYAPGAGWQVMGSGFGNSSSYLALSTTGSATNSGAWSASLPQPGAYDVYAFIPWVDNHNAETSSARYTVSTSNGDVTVTSSQKAITDAGDGRGEWMHLGRFNFGANARVSLTNQTGDSGKNVWFDAMMWIPSSASAPPPTAQPTNTPVPVPTATPTTPTSTGPCGMSFSDLPAGDWAYDYVANLYCRGILGGYTDGTFRPGISATRVQLAKMLVLAAGWPVVQRSQATFSDVPMDSPFFAYVETAVEHQVISGYADGTFRPGDSVTRAQFSKMMAQTKGWFLAYPPAPSFGDVPADNWAYGFIETARARGIISGYADGSFRPGASVTRAQIAKLLALAFP